ncbi:8-oxo-dGTP diphosphatase MutT [Marinomonas balearica]|uniref:8-oxo-dGTP diphosphatase n=1 Tax=Marinomonas balearica TaxID=491947 RepID=A0A4R6MBR2_9GAMM|nr:8-oxo-dGTP diphosphatase MutT [Marinomonas balearica]TDO99057.1 8-oxo-dGTPase [Marinomonas balearica]
MTLIQVSAGIIKRDDRIFLAFRDEAKHQGGLWEFPGGKCEAGESSYDALCRELLEECAIAVSSATLFKEVRHDYEDKSVVLYFYLVEAFKGEPAGAEGQNVSWVQVCELNDLQFPAANQVIVDELVAQCCELN